MTNKSGERVAPENSEPQRPARLLVVSGPKNGKVLEIAEDCFSIGRDPESSLSLKNRSVSRRHCLIQKQGSIFRILDEESMNGTLVNGVPIKDRALRHGDRIQVGTSVLLFLDEPENQHFAPPFEFEEDSDGVSASALRLNPEETLYLSSDAFFNQLAAPAQITRNLEALLEICKTVNTAASIEELAGRLLDLILRVVPGEQGGIFLAESDANEFNAVCVRSPNDAGTIKVSRSVISEVFAGGQSILDNNLKDAERFGAANSVVELKIHSVLCVPLSVSGKTIGAIYLDSRSAANLFNRDHLEILSAVSGVVSGAFQRFQLVRWLEEETTRLREDLWLQQDLIGESEPMKKVYERIARLATTDSTVLVRGESGTGKELAARAIHRYSSRKKKPFVAINCAALTETLLESELFGHERGAFTGAIERKKGKLEIADGGTVFLDEIAEMPQSIQAKLLRFLQERQFERVGGTRTLQVDIRIIAATNQNLEEAIKGGHFRQDLYYRLNVVPLVLPPLRDRREDIPLLAHYFAARNAAKLKRHFEGFHRDVRKCLRQYDWPGNVRELENAVEHAVVLGSSPVIRPEDLPETLLTVDSPQDVRLGRYHETLKQRKVELILEAFEESAGNLTEAAKLLGIHPNYLHRLVRNLKLKEKLDQIRSR